MQTESADLLLFINNLSEVSIDFDFRFRMVTVVGLNLVGFLLVAYAGQLWVALAGVVAMSIASGLGEVTLLAYTAFYKDKYVPAQLAVYSCILYRNSENFKMV